ncbi:MAG: hypothetical protein KDC27_11505 [Acidobacteria bacterium]|nr:hypothetical protein [Acidobacteriota bacterium]
MASPARKTFTLRKSAGVIETRTDIEVAAPAEIAEMLTSRAAFPAELDAIRLADVQLSAVKGDKTVSFAAGAGKVAFSGAGGPFGGLGVYRDAAALSRDLACIATGDASVTPPLERIPFAQVEAARFCVLYAGYGAEAAAGGAVALGPSGGATFDGGLGRRRAFAVIQAHAQEPPAYDAVRALIEAWRMPSQVASAADLPQGTWILAEVSGSVRANAGVRFGLDFEWVRSVQSGELAGDVGLAIQAGANAAFGVHASDRFVVLVGRDSLDAGDECVRVRLHRLDEHGWSFAATAAVSLRGSTGALTPAQMDDFLAAILGVHGMQTLQEVRRWTDPDAALSEVAADFLDRHAQQRFGEPLSKRIDEVRAEALGWFAKWDSLPARAVSGLWDLIRLDEEAVRAFVSHVEKLAAGNDEAVRAEVAAIVSRADLAETPVGLWLEAVASERVMGVLTSLPQTAAVREAAAKTLAVLDGALLGSLRSYVEQQVGLAPVREAIRKDDFQALNAKLKAKLAAFLGKSRLDSKAVEDVRKTVAALDGRAGDLYQACVRALNDTYRATFDYAYQRSVSKTALLDVSFDFAAAGAQAKRKRLSEMLEAALAGDFRAVLPPPGEAAPEGVSFHEAALTHHLQRSTSVKIRLPFFDSTTVKRCSSLGSFRILAEDGAVRLYELEAEDDVRSVGKWRSTMSVSLALETGVGVRRHDGPTPRGSVDYRFMRRLPGLRTEQFRRLLEALRGTYFPHALGGPEAPEKPSPHEWALALDKLVDGASQQREDGLIGDAWFDLQASLPGEAVARWLDAPGERGDRLYAEISRRIQRLLRRFVPFLYFQDAARYRDLGSARPLLVYAALPVATSVRLRRGGLVELDAGGDVYWDWVDRSETGARRALLADPRTSFALAAQLANAAAILESAGDPELRKLARRYGPGELEDARRSVVEPPGRTLLENLLANEASVIEGAVRAGLDLARFRERAADPEKAVAALAHFGETMTRTFHRKLKSVFKPTDPADRELLRNLGLLVFGEVSEALPPGTPLYPAARLELTLFRPGRMPAELGEAPEGAVLVRQALFEAGEG